MMVLDGLLGRHPRFTVCAFLQLLTSVTGAGTGLGQFPLTNPMSITGAGAGNAAGGSQCDLEPKWSIPFPGTFEGDACTTMPGSVFVCAMQCEAVPQCKLIFSHECPTPENCVCGYCTTIKKFDFHMPHSMFFIHTAEIASNTHEVPLTGGLVPGQPLLMIITLSSYLTQLNFMSTWGDNVFHTEIRFHEGSVVSNSYINGLWANEDRYTPHFNFQQGQELGIVCHVTSAAFMLFLEDTLFKFFPHRYQDLSSITFFRLTSPGFASTILSFRR